MDISAFDINQYRYQSNISTLSIINTFITYFVICSIRKTALGDFTQIENSQQQTGVEVSEIVTAGVR